MPKPQTQKQPKKISKSLKIIAAIIVTILLIPLLYWIYTYTVNHINQPLGSGNDFVFIQQEISNGPLTVPTETFYYATNVPPQDFTTKFPGWKVYHMSDDTTGETLTTLVLEKDGHQILVNYSSRAQYARDPIPTGDFKGKQYIVFIRGTSMYFLNPNNIHPSMKQQIQEDISRNYIR